MLRKLALTFWYVAASVLVLAAVVIGVLRYYPSFYQRYLPAIQVSISSIMGNPVYAESINVVWDGYTPHVTVKGLRIYSDDTRIERLLFAKEVRLSFDLYESLVHQRLDIRQLTLIGSKLEATWTADKKIIINGIDIGERFAHRQKRDNGTAVSFLDSAITIKDETRNLTYFVTRADLAFDFYQDRFRAAANFSLPDTLGESLTLIADVQHLERGLSNVLGNLYVKGSNINIGLLNDFFPHFQAGVKAGSSDFEVWGNLDPFVQHSFSGRLNIRGLRYHHVEKAVEATAVGQEVTAIDTRFQVKGKGGSWYLALVDSTVQAADKQWFGKKYEIRCDDCNGSNFSVVAALDHIDVTHLLSTLQHYPILMASLDPLLTKVRVGGTLESTDISARWTDGRLSKYSYKAFLRGANMSVPGQEIEVSSLVGTVRGNHLQGDLEINAAELHIQAGGSIVDDLFEVQKVAGGIKWKHTNRGVIASLEGVSLEAPGISTHLQGFIRADGEGLYLDLQGKISEARLVAIKNYLSFKKINPKLVKWLREGIHGGTFRNARFLFRGRPESFPFKDRSGVFQAVLSVEDGILSYYKDWPEVRNLHADLKAENKRLVIVGRQGTILRSSVERATVTIDDLKLPRLIIDGEVFGPASDLLDYLKRSSLIPNDSRISEKISFSGNTKLNLDIALTLTKKLKKERKISGVVDFDNTDMVVVPLSLPFKNIKGSLKFNQNKIDSHDLSAVLYGSTFKANTQGLEDKRLLLTVMGDFNIDSHFGVNPGNAGGYIGGTVPVKATLNLPRFGKHDGDKSLIISVDSNLIGTRITLPEPFYKEADVGRKFVLQTKYQAGKGYPLFVNFADELFVKALFDERARVFSAMELRIGNDRFSLPEKGLKVSGILQQLNLLDWQDVFVSSDNGNFPALHEVDMRVDKVFISDLEIKDVNFQLLKKAQSWTGKIDSSIAKGSFSYPFGSDVDGVVTAAFDYLFFRKPEKEIIEIDPRKLPSLEVYSKQFEFNDYPFYDVTLKTTATDNGMMIDSLAGRSKDLWIKANGTWEIDKSNEHRTDLDIVATTENLHNSLVALGFDTVIEEGKGIVTSKFNWPNAPYQFSAENFTGITNLDFDDGKISSVNPGAGRLIGVFNLGEISRRLSLDFADFFSKGYAFKKIQGDLFFKDANLNTENLIITGTSADISIAGRTGIAARDYDQIVTITPHVAGGLPWIGLAVGGPIGAAGVYVGEKVAKKLGIDVNKVVEVEYSITGSWEHPKIEPVAKVEATPSAENQP